MNLVNDVLGSKKKEIGEKTYGFGVSAYEWDKSSM